MMLFLDASALVVRYLGGSGSEAIRQIIRDEQGEGSGISAISVLAFSILLLELRTEGVPPDRLTQAGLAFQGELANLVRIQVDPCLAMAGRLAIRHGLKLEPAIQLAAALHLEDRLEWNAKALPAPLVRMVTLDPVLAEAARAERLPTGP